MTSEREGWDSHAPVGGRARVRDDGRNRRREDRVVPDIMVRGWKVGMNVRIRSRRSIRAVCSIRSRLEAQRSAPDPLSRRPSARARTLRATLLAGICALALNPGAEARGDSEGGSLDIASPADGERIRLSAPLVEVSGRIQVPELFDSDVVIAIDLSQTTLFASGLDLDRDGVTGSTREWAREKKLHDRHHNLWTSDPDDAVIHSELIAARALVQGLSQRRNRIAVLTYTETPLVRAYLGPASRALEAIDAISFSLDTAGTDVGRVLAASARMLDDAREQEGGNRPRAVLLFTDGKPEGTNFDRLARAEFWAVRAALEEASELANDGIDLYILSFGEVEEESTKFLESLARAAGGSLLQVGRPGLLLNDLPSVVLAPLRLEIMNETTGERARALRTSDDGRFDAFLPLVPGENRLTVQATMWDGRLLIDQRVVHYQKPVVETEVDRRNAARMLIEMRRRTQTVAEETGAAGDPAQ